MKSRWADRHLDKPTEVRNGGEFVETSGDLLLAEEWDARWWRRAVMVVRKAEPSPREP